MLLHRDLALFCSPFHVGGCRKRVHFSVQLNTSTRVCVGVGRVRGVTVKLVSIPSAVPMRLWMHVDVAVNTPVQPGSSKRACLVKGSRFPNTTFPIVSRSVSPLSRRKEGPCCSYTTSTFFCHTQLFSDFPHWSISLSLLLLHPLCLLPLLIVFSQRFCYHIMAEKLGPKACWSSPCIWCVSITLRPS